MAKMSYAEQLKHPNWQKKRLERLSDASWVCENCGQEGMTLHVHHKRYVKGRMAWEYEDYELAVLCENCHAKETKLTDELHFLLTAADVSVVLALANGYLSNDVMADDPWTLDQAKGVDPWAWRAGIVAMLISHLPGVKQKQVAEFAVSMTRENSEARAILDKYSDIFTAFD